LANTKDNHTRMIPNAEMEGNPNRHFHAGLLSGTITESLSWAPDAERVYLIGEFESNAN